MIEIVYFLPFGFVQSLVTELDEGPKARSAELLRWVFIATLNVAAIGYIVLRPLPPWPLERTEPLTLCDCRY